MRLITLLALLLPSVLLAEQTVINNYDDARGNYFYKHLYINDIGESLYCGITRPITVGGGRSLEHVYPADWMATEHGCANRNTYDNPTQKEIYIIYGWL